MEKEMDLSIALFIREQRKRDQEAQRESQESSYDLKAHITYTLEDLIEGVRRGKQYLYTLRLEFEPRKLLEGRITIPYIKNFFDVEEDGAETALLASNQRKAAMNFSHCGDKILELSLDEWMAETKELMKKMHLYIKPERKKSLGNLEYFCFTVPTSGGRLYNVTFRMRKDGRLYAGALNCPEKEREGMGLLLEAVVCVIEEMNR